MPESPVAGIADAPNSAPVRDSRFRFRWDVILFGGFVFTALPHATGTRPHEWVSLALIFVIVVHLTLNWSWVLGTTRQMFRHLPATVRFNATLNFALFVFMALTMVSGVLTSRRALPAIGIPLTNPDYFWTHTHGIFGYTTVAIVALHVLAHLSWIKANVKRARANPMNEGARRVSVATFAGRAVVVMIVSLAMGFAVLQLNRTTWADNVREDHRRYLQDHPLPVLKSAPHR